MNKYKIALTLVSLMLVSGVVSAEEPIQKIPDEAIEATVDNKIHLGWQGTASSPYTFDKTTHINVSGANNVQGIYIYGNGSVAAEEGKALKITVDATGPGTTSAGIFLRGYATMAGENSITLNQVNILASGDAFGIKVDAPISQAGKTYSYKVEIGDKSWIQSGVRPAISLTGGNKTSDKIEHSVEMTVGNDALLVSETDNSNTGTVNAINGSKLTIGDRAIIKNVNEKDNLAGHAVLAGFGTRTKDTESYAGIIDIGKRAKISTVAKQSHGLFATGHRSKITIDEGANIVAEGEDSHAVFAEKSGKVELKGGYIESQQGKSIAADGIDPFVKQGNALVTGEGVFEIHGDMKASNDGKIDMDFLDASQFTGSTLIENNGIIDFKMKDNSLWNMTGASNLTSLEFNGAESNINFLGTDVEGYTTLTTDSLTGDGGHFNMRVDIPAETGDKLIVTSEQVAGNHLVSVENKGGANVTGNEKITIIETQKDTASENFTLTNNVELGGYEYELKAKEGQTNHLELRATGKATDPADGGVNLFGSNYMLAYAETQTLMQRLGDLRRGEDGQKEGDMWARAYGGKLSSGGDSMLRSYDMKYSGFQLGMDRSIDRKDGKGTSYAGAFVGYTNGSPSYKTGDGDIDGFSIGGYYTYMHETGFYTDLVMKYGWYDNEYNIRDSAGQKVKAESDSKVLSLSLEVGKRFHFDKEKSEGYYIEPQAQFTYAHFTGDTYRASNGLTTKVDSFASKLARVGMHLGYETKNTKNPMNLYIKGYFMKEFDGNIDYRFNGGNKHRSSYEDNWFVYGFGATMQLGSKKNQNLYLDFERSSGGRMKQDWAINAGYRYSW